MVRPGAARRPQSASFVELFRMSRDSTSGTLVFLLFVLCFSPVAATCRARHLAAPTEKHTQKRRPPGRNLARSREDCKSFLLPRISANSVEKRLRSRCAKFSPGVVTHHPAVAHPVIVAPPLLGQGTLGQWLGTRTCERQVPGFESHFGAPCVACPPPRNPLCRANRPHKDGSQGT